MSATIQLSFGQHLAAPTRHRRDGQLRAVVKLGHTLLPCNRMRGVTRLRARGPAVAVASATAVTTPHKRSAVLQWWQRVWPVVVPATLVGVLVATGAMPSFNEDLLARLAACGIVISPHTLQTIKVTLAAIVAACTLAAMLLATLKPRPPARPSAAARGRQALDQLKMTVAARNQQFDQRVEKLDRELQQLDRRVNTVGESIDRLGKSFDQNLGQLGGKLERLARVAEGRKTKKQAPLRE